MLDFTNFSLFCVFSLFSNFVDITAIFKKDDKVILSTSFQSTFWTELLVSIFSLHGSDHAGHVLVYQQCSAQTMLDDAVRCRKIDFRNSAWATESGMRRIA